MNKEKALALLNLESFAEASQVESAYAAKKSATEQKLEAAPTDVLKQKFAKLLKQLAEARDLLLVEANNAPAALVPGKKVVAVAAAAGGSSGMGTFLG